MKSRRSWSAKEDEAFSKLTKQSDTKNWAVISKRLASQHGFKRRSGKQCRQRWYNHLVPGISKRIWTKNEEEKLLALHNVHGNKWTVIAEHMPGRTDNSIKNYFYSTVRRSLRRMGKLIGSKNSTSILRAIKPSTLTQIFSVLTEHRSQPLPLEFQEEFETIENLRKCCQNIRNQIIQFSSFKPKRTDGVSQQEKKRYQKVFQMIIKLNGIYQRIKGVQKNNKSEEEIFRDNFKQMMKQDSDQQNQQSIVSDSAKQSQELSLPQIIITRTTRTRMIRLPDKLSQNYIQSSTSSVKQQETNKIEERKLTIQEQLQERSIHMQNIESEEINNPPQFEDPQFHIELKDDIGGLDLLGLNCIQASPSFYFGTPAHQINFFKSPMACLSHSPRQFIASIISQQKRSGEKKSEQNNK